MKKRIQSFGIGLFLAGAVITLFTQFTDFQQEKDNDEITRLKNQLLAAEQEIATLNEAIAQNSIHTEENKAAEASSNSSAATKKNEKDSSEEKDKSPEGKNKSSKDQLDSSTPNTTTGTILIYEGVTLYDIGKQAEDQGIVKNGRELELFLYKPEYARSLQKGQFDLNSSMSLEEIAKILTGKQ